jgi:hypothetical protein
VVAGPGARARGARGRERRGRRQLGAARPAQGVGGGGNGGRLEAHAATRGGGMRLFRNETDEGRKKERVYN